MRGTPRKTNKALYEPILIMGCERALFIIGCIFWGWAFSGVMPHFLGVVLVGFLFVCTIYVMRFTAKRDPQGFMVFKRNGRFLLGNRYFQAKGFAGNVEQIKKVVTVPLNLTSRM